MLKGLAPANDVRLFREAQKKAKTVMQFPRIDTMLYAVLIEKEQSIKVCCTG